MMPYECLSTGRDVGMLEVVQDSETIANIQKAHSDVKLASSFGHSSLFKWLEKKNPDKIR